MMADNGTAQRTNHNDEMATDTNQACYSWFADIMPDMYTQMISLDLWLIAYEIN